MLLVGAAGLPAGATAKTALTVYTALEADQLPEYKAAFESANRYIELNWVRDSTGIVTAKLLAEKDNPQADVIWGLAATSLLVLDKEGMLEPYAPAGLEKLAAAYRDTRNPPAWVGMDVWGAVICFNTVQAEKLGLEEPTAWKDLLKPEYKGTLVMPNPASSGTGYLMVSSWLQMMGEEEGWKFLDALNDNAAVYTHSGSKPCKMAAAGEYPMGLSFEYRASKSKAEGAPIDIVFPSEGLGWDMEATAMVKGTQNLEAAKKLVDWSITPEANALYNKSYAIVALPGVAKPVEFIPANYEGMLIQNDFGWAAENRERVLSEWQKRYDSKSEPKS